MKNRKNLNKNLKIVLLFIFIVFFSNNVFSISISEINTPSGRTTYENVDIMYNFSISNLDYVKFKFDNIEYSLFDNSLVLFFNFDNRSSLKENGTFIRDLSRLENNLTGGLPNSVWSSYGKYGGAFIMNGVDSIASVSIQSLRNVEGVTICSWIYYLGESSDTYWNLFKKTNGANASNEIRIHVINATKRIAVEQWKEDFSSATAQQAANIPLNNTWYHFCSVTTSNTAKLFLNGSLIDADYGFSNFNVSHTFLFTINSDFNGSIDNLMVWNRSLTDNEIKYVYESSITKYNNTNFNLYLNKSIIRDGVYRGYSMCISNISNELCSNIKTIYGIVGYANISAYFNNYIGKVNPTFYGINIQSPRRWFGQRLLDTDHDGITETESNYSWQRETFLKGGFGFARFDGDFNSYFIGLENPNIEYWINDTTIFATSGAYERVHGYRVSFSNTGASGWIGKSIDSYDGGVSLNVTGNGTGGVYIETYPLNNGSLLLLKNNSYYIASFFVKGNGTFVAIFQENGGTYASCNSTYFNLTIADGWKNINVTCNTSSTIPSHNYRLILADDIKRGEWILVDQISMFENGKKRMFWEKPSANFTKFENVFKFAKDNDIYVLLIADYMPEFIANRSVGACISNEFDNDFDDCLPYDMNLYGEMVSYFINRSIQNTNYSVNKLYIEFWNEPYGSSFLDQYGYDDIRKATAYVSFYNASYVILKRDYPNIKIGGPSGHISYNTSDGTTRFAPNLMKHFLNNLSNSFDFVSTHTYRADFYPNVNFNVLIQNDTEYIKNLCSLYNSGNGCNHIIYSEWNLGNASAKNNTKGYNKYWAMQIATAYYRGLKSYSSNISFLIYHADDSYSYFNNPSYYPEYPSLWSTWSEAGLDDRDPVYYAPYNITKNFYQLCQPNSKVYDVYSNDNDLEAISCISLDGKIKSLIIINEKNEGKEINILSDYGFINYLTGEKIPNSFVLDGYNTLFLYADKSNYIKINNPFCNDFPSYLVMFVFFMIITFVIMIFLSNPNNVNNIIAILSAIVALLIVFAFISIFIESICS